jgi:hypothetical protein
MAVKMFMVVFKVEDGGSMFLQNVGPTHPIQCSNPEDHHEQKWFSFNY